MLIEGSLLALAILAWRKAGEKGKWTAEREEVYLQALEHLKDPAKLRILANAFEKEGFHVKALALRKRADLRGASEATKKARSEAFAKGMASTNIDGILKLAEAFDEATATGAAAALRKRVVQLRIQASSQIHFSTPVEEKKTPTIPAPPPSAAIIDAVIDEPDTEKEIEDEPEDTEKLESSEEKELANGSAHAE
jgi:hypothetical protein